MNNSRGEMYMYNRLYHIQAPLLYVFVLARPTFQLMTRTHYQRAMNDIHGKLVSSPVPYKFSQMFHLSWE